jgi:low temperature requirement protein LtrA
MKNFKPHRGEIWYELFYDLIYVAAAGEIGKLAEHDTTPWSLIKCGIIFAVLRDVRVDSFLLIHFFLLLQTWDQLMFYQNRFDTKDMIHHLYYFLQAFCALILACSLTADHEGHWDVDRNLKSFATAAGICRLLHSFMYSQIYSMTKTFQLQIQILILSQGASAVLYFFAAFYSLQFGEDIYLYLFLAALILERFLSHLFLAIIKAPIMPWHIHHLFSREVSSSTTLLRPSDHYPCVS